MPSGLKNLYSCRTVRTDPICRIDDAAERQGHHEQDDDGIGVAHAVDAAHRMEKAASLPGDGPRRAYGLMRDCAKQKDRQYSMDGLMLPRG